MCKTIRIYCAELWKTTLKAIANFRAYSISAQNPSLSGYLNNL